MGKASLNASQRGVSECVSDTTKEGHISHWTLLIFSLSFLFVRFDVSVEKAQFGLERRKNAFMFVTEFFTRALDAQKSSERKSLQSEMLQFALKNCSTV